MSTGASLRSPRSFHHFGLVLLAIFDISIRGPDEVGACGAMVQI
jgi:hypothetical protein